MLNSALLVCAYAFIGAGIKYVDQVFDEGFFSRKFAMLLSVVGSTLVAYLMLTDPFSATILLALIIGMSASRKVDNIAFYLAATIAIVLPAIIVYTNGYSNGRNFVEWWPLGLLILSAVSDERLHDYVEKRRKTGLAAEFFYYRPVMKFSMIGLAYLLIFPYIYLIAFFAFDISYTIVEHLSLRGRKKRNVKWLKKHNHYHGHQG